MVKQNIILYNILEIANSHGGNINYIFSLIDEFLPIVGNIGLKYQPFHYDLIATKDFHAYSIYKKLFFNRQEWKDIINKSSISKDIWLDIFDEYSIEILSCNLLKIFGIKLQSSVLKNRKVIYELSKLNLNGKKIILNISGYNLSEIKEIVDFIEERVKSEEIILQVGFQDYPTKLVDSGLGKIIILKNNFPNSISFADHIDAEDEESIRLPVSSIMFGASYIEKHIKHSKMETKYDYYSSLTFNKYSKYLNIASIYMDILNDNFVNPREKLYLEKTIQLPLANKKIKSGKTLDLISDINFKRGNSKGLSIDSLEELNASFHILRKSKNKDESFYMEDFKKANIATIIAARLKSSRLPKKAILKIGKLSSIELCIKNCLKFSNINHTILATSDLEEDQELKNYTYDTSVIFHCGHPDDVIQRYLDIIDKLKIDIVIRLTGDCPYPSNDILQILLKSHFKNGADYTKANKSAIGTSMEIINTSALKKVKTYFPSADYSEYMTYYFTNNPSYFNLNFVNLPEDLIRNYRLTLDYQEDLILFNKIENYFSEKNEEYGIKEIFEFLDNNQDIAKINSKCKLKYLEDKNLVKIITEKTTIRSKK